MALIVPDAGQGSMSVMAIYRQFERMFDLSRVDNDSLGADVVRYRPISGQPQAL